MRAPFNGGDYGHAHEGSVGRVMWELVINDCATRLGLAGKHGYNINSHQSSQPKVKLATQHQRKWEIAYASPSTVEQNLNIITAIVQRFGTG